jgi:hypothetical protein
MTARFRNFTALLGAAVALAACASGSDAPPTSWIGGDAAHLAADKAACHKQADSVDVSQANDYSDTHYGAATAMAAAIDREDPLRGHNKGAREATFQTCMGDKGWRAE